MDSESNTHRKGFLKRAGLAVATIFAVSSTARAASAGAASAGAASAGSASADSQSTPTRAMARVRTAKGAVARRA